jgi:transposase
VLCAWLAWSRFRVVIPIWDRRLGTLLTCLDTTLRRLGGAPTYGLTDNEKTVTVEHVAGIPVRHPMIVAAGRHYGLTVHTCIPFDPESKGGSEFTVRIAKADLVPTKANLRSGYNSFAELAEACVGFCEKVNNRVHRETDRIPAEALLVEKRRCIRSRTPRSPPRSGRPAPSTPTRPSGSGRCATPPHPAWSAARYGSAATVRSW